MLGFTIPILTTAFNILDVPALITLYRNRYIGIDLTQVHPLDVVCGAGNGGGRTLTGGMALHFRDIGDGLTRCVHEQLGHGVGLVDLVPGMGLDAACAGCICEVCVLVLRFGPGMGAIVA